MAILSKLTARLPKPAGSQSSSLLAKRIFDLLLVVGTAPLWLPISLIIALLVRVKLGSPVLFRQRRPGWKGITYELVKFRTMTEAKDEFGNLLPDAERLPPFGQWLRSTSLDELPEFLNVIKGEMSLVGPRPLLIQYLDRYTPRQRMRHDVPPGLTGWAQINGRNAISWDEKFAFDVWYVEHRSLALDVKILLVTVWYVIARKNISAQGSATMPEYDPSRQKDEPFS